MQSIKTTSDTSPPKSLWYKQSNKLNQRNFSNIKNILDFSLKEVFEIIISINSNLKMALKNSFTSYFKGFNHEIKSLKIHMEKIMSVCIFNNIIPEKCKKSLYRDIFKIQNIKDIRKSLATIHQ